MEFYFLTSLIFVFICCADSKAIVSSATSGSTCRFPDGVAGVCEPLAVCRPENGGFFRRNDTIVRCAASSPVLYVCCRKPNDIAKKMCDTWGRYWREKSGEADAPCVEESPLIHGGVEANLGEFPHMVALGHNTLNGIQWKCGATLLTPLYVMTAAHCFFRKNLVWFVGLGEHNTNLQVTTKIPTMDFGFPEGLAGAQEILANFKVEAPTEQIIEIEQVTPYPHYRKMYHDIALLRLKTPASLTSRVLPACLSLPSPAPTKQQFVAAGWGNVGFNGGESPTLQKVAVKYVDPIHCFKRLEKLTPLSVPPLGITSDMFCAGDEGKDSCRGDSGGPLMDEPKLSCQPRVVTGIVSFGPACDSMGVYTKVSSYLDWITSIVAPDAVHVPHDGV